MSNGKTFDQLRGDIIADIQAVRKGEMPVATATVIFQGIKELTATINTEIAATRMCLLTEGKAHEFGKVVRMGRRKVNGDEDGNEETQ